MIRFLDDREISKLKNNYNNIVSSKILLLDKNVEKFYKGELTLDAAIKTYIHLVNANYFNYTSLNDANEIMVNYMSKYEEDIFNFLQKTKPYCNYYEENSDYYDEMFENYEDVVDNITDIMRLTLKDSCLVTRTSLRSLIYDFDDDDLFDDRSREMLFRTRKEILDHIGGFCNAVFWYPDYMKNLPIEERLPDEDDFYDSFQCECSIIAVKFNDPAIIENVYLSRTLNRTIGGKGAGVGINSEIYFEDGTLFFTITSELTLDVDYSTFIMLSIIIYEIKKRWLLLGKDNSRVS